MIRIYVYDCYSFIKSPVNPLENPVCKYKSRHFLSSESLLYYPIEHGNRKNNKTWPD